MKKSTKLKKTSKKAAPKKIAKKAIKKVAKKAAPKKKAGIKKSWHHLKDKVDNSTIGQALVQKKIPTFGVKKKVLVYKDAVINDVTFLHDYVLLVKFTDGHEQQVDFSVFLNSDATPPYMKKYKSESKFKRFKVEEGNLVWGKDWDLIFPIEQLYHGKIN